MLLQKQGIESNNVYQILVEGQPCFEWKHLLARMAGAPKSGFAALFVAVALVGLPKKRLFIFKP